MRPIHLTLLVKNYRTFTRRYFWKAKFVASSATKSCQPTASACVHSKRRTYTKDEHPYHYEELSLSNLDILIFGSTDISVFGRRKEKDKEKAEKWKIMYVLGGILEAHKKKNSKAKLMKLTKATTIFYLFTCPYLSYLLQSMVARWSIRNKWKLKNERICRVGCRGIERRMILTYAWIIV